MANSIAKLCEGVSCIKCPFDINEDGQHGCILFERLLSLYPQISVTGHWIKEKSMYGWDGKSYQCSKCGRSIHIDPEVEDLSDYSYCHCGAKMQEIKE